MRQLIHYYNWNTNHGCSEQDEWIDGCNDVKEDPDSAVSKLGFDEPSELGCQTGVDIENPQGQKEPRNEKSGPENEAPVPAHPMKYVDETREEGQDLKWNENNQIYISMKLYCDETRVALSLFCPNWEMT